MKNQHEQLTKLLLGLFDEPVGVREFEDCIEFDCILPDA